MTLLAQLGDPPIDPDPPISPWLVAATIIVLLAVEFARRAIRRRTPTTPVIDDDDEPELARDLVDHASRDRR